MGPAGKLKGAMDPFKEVAPEDEAITRELLEDLHGTFQDVVLASRSAKLTAPHSELFSGARHAPSAPPSCCRHSRLVHPPSRVCGMLSIPHAAVALVTCLVHVPRREQGFNRSG
jgi:hypothetical protein